MWTEATRRWLEGAFCLFALASGDGKRYLCGVCAREDREVVSLALRGEVWLLVEREALQKSLPVNVLTGGPLLMPLLTSQSVGGWGGWVPTAHFLDSSSVASCVPRAESFQWGAENPRYGFRIQGLFLWSSPFLPNLYFRNPCLSEFNFNTQCFEDEVISIFMKPGLFKERSL